MGICPVPALPLLFSSAADLQSLFSRLRLRSLVVYATAHYLVPLQHIEAELSPGHSVQSTRILSMSTDTNGPGVVLLVRSRLLVHPWHLLPQNFSSPNEIGTLIVVELLQPILNAFL